MGDVAIPAYYTAHLRHFRQLLQEGERGPSLPPVITRNLSTSLFSTSFTRLKLHSNLGKLFWFTQKAKSTHLSFSLIWSFPITAYFKQMMLLLGQKELQNY
jgi:hypothetical protein